MNSAAIERHRFARVLYLAYLERDTFLSGRSLDGRQLVSLPVLDQHLISPLNTADVRRALTDMGLSGRTSGPRSAIAL
ncbi:hypothetical protein VTO73DRAFT_4399 [Trametes versicolor]